MNKKICCSTVFKKFIMGLTGLALVGFVIVHLLGNLLLFKSNPDSFNQYAETLHQFGIGLYLAEAGLVVILLAHAINGIKLTRAAKKARPQKYLVHKSKGGDSHWGLSSRFMAISGAGILIFLVLHIIHFKFGPGIAQGYATQVGGKEVRDLHLLVSEQFQNLWIVLGYCVAMVFLGIHLKHGIWSAIHSLGLTRESTTKLLYRIGGLLAFLISAGFIAIPIYLYIFGGSL